MNSSLFRGVLIGSLVLGALGPRGAEAQAIAEYFKFPDEGPKPRTSKISVGGLEARVFQKSRGGRLQSKNPKELSGFYSPGDLIGYHVRIKNAGPDRSDPIPFSLTVSADSNTQTASWTVPALKPGETESDPNTGTMDVALTAKPTQTISFRVTSQGTVFVKDSYTVNLAQGLTTAKLALRTAHGEATPGKPATVAFGEPLQLVVAVRNAGGVTPVPNTFNARLVVGGVQLSAPGQQVKFAAGETKTLTFNFTIPDEKTFADVKTESPGLTEWKLPVKGFFAMDVVAQGVTGPNETFDRELYAFRKMKGGGKAK